MISDALTGEIIIPAGNLSGERVTESFSEDQPSEIELRLGGKAASR